MSAAGYAWVVLLFPLAGMIVIALGWKVLKGTAAGWIGSASILGSFIASLGCLQQITAIPPEERHIVTSAFTYVRTAGVTVDMGLLVDPLSVFMSLVVSGVSFLIHVYSVGYLASDEGYVRYFSYLNYFVFSMLLLVLAGNFVLLTVGWAFVGAASYLLISFWYRRSTATTAGIKAFVMNVIGDVGLVLGTFLIFRETGALDFLGVFEAAPEAFGRNDGTIVAACLLLLVAAFAKSGQLPLHTWLPDAMEGPTPVSSLIHAATMVTAGVYLIARTYPLFELAPAAADTAAIIGTATLLFAATVALVQTDFKRIIAYSTISQIGYMVLGVSAFAYGAGLFHLMTHAFFKALLFMGAGSVIGAMGGEQNIDRMGGFRYAMPFTHVTFAVAALSLAGFPLTAGFFSKDEILAYTINRGGLYVVLGIVGYVAAFMTAFYSFRMVFRVFWGDPVPEALAMERGEHLHAEHRNPATGEEEDTDVGFPGPEHHDAEHSLAMKLGMAPLAVGALFAWVVGIPHLTDTLEHFLEPTFADSAYLDTAPSESAEYLGLAVGAVLAVLGILLAYRLYLARPGTTLRLRDSHPGLHRFLARKWYFDELYDLAVVRPWAAFGRFGRNVVESGFVQGVLVGGTSDIVRAFSYTARAIQSGYLRAYAALLLAGLSVMALYFLIVAA